MAAPRRVILHAGTHKTGTKTLQAFFQENRLAFARAGMYVPAAGRAPLGEAAMTPGHHALAWELLDGRRDALDAVLDDVAGSNAPTVILSSEDFSHLHAHPERALPLRDAFNARGYAITVVLYLRAQGPYAESLYAELTKAGAPPHFGAFVEDALARGAVHLSPTHVLPFDYDRLLLGFARILGTQYVVARPYVDAADSRGLIDDALRVVARLHGGLDARDLHLSLPRANRRGTFGAVAQRMIDALGSAAAAIEIPPELASTPFAPLAYEQALGLIERFAASNAAVEEMARIAIPGTRAHELPAHDAPQWSIARRQRELLARICDIGLR